MSIKKVLSIIANIVAIYVLNSFVFGIVSGFIPNLRHVMPLKGITSIGCLYLVILFSIYVVGFGNGLLLMDFKIMRLGALFYILFDWLIALGLYIERETFIHEAGKINIFSLPAVILHIGSVILAFLVLISLKSIYTFGKKVRLTIQNSNNWNN